MLSYQDNAVTSTIEQFITMAAEFDMMSTGETIKTFFEQNPAHEGIVVTDTSYPVGLIMRNNFFQKLGSLYGNSLYLKRPISILMDTHFMTADVKEQLSGFGSSAMSREPGKRYDYVLAFDGRKYVGVISIHRFLDELSKLNEAQISLLKDQHKKLITLNEQEQKLRRKIEYQADSVRNLLDNADQGFLWFGSDLVIKKDFSYKCSEIFNSQVGGCDYLELMSNFWADDKIDVCRLTFDSFFKNSSSLTDNVYLMLLPQSCQINNRHIAIQYRRIDHKGKKALMVILSDQTERVKMQEALEFDRYRQRLIIKTFSSQSQIRQLINDITNHLNGSWQDLISDKSTVTEGLQSLFRTVHTYKGELAQFGFLRSSDKIHECEDKLMELMNNIGAATFEQIKSIMTSYSAVDVLKADLDTIREMTGSDIFGSAEKLIIEASKLTELLTKVKARETPINSAEVVRLISGLRYQSLKKIFEDYHDYISWLAGRLNKSMPSYVVDGDDVEVDPIMLQDFLHSIVHIFRNAMDHGLETDEERLESGKPIGGLIECLISKNSDSVSISIRDDGRGLNINQIRHKAVKLGLINAEQEYSVEENSLTQLIFSDCFSTKDSISNISGRGVGMSAVRAACDSLGGSIDVLSKPNHGTSVIITLPINRCYV
ncbi:MAG: two-component system, chemotaxis family, sensor kinase CheA [Clostridiales bacterium]|jgi:two-component system chemotaxis sensor kinase CheA|nr:two-component system, chemotaxis family, sensor kinase CheA [Clostridiales bacterium]